MTASRREFITEAEDLLDSAQARAIGLQEEVDAGRVSPDGVNALFRDVHTLKGLAGLFGLPWITDLSHRLESLLDDLRLGAIQPTAAFAEFLLRNLDLLRALVRSSGKDEVVDVSPHLAAIDEFKRRAGTREGGPDLAGLIDEDIRRVLSQYEEHRFRENIKAGNGIYALSVVFGLNDFDTRLGELSGRIRAGHELLSTLPRSGSVPPGQIGFTLVIGSTNAPEELAAGLGHPLTVLVPSRSAPRAGAEESSLKSGSTTVRVDIEKLDLILNTLGEINLARGAVKRISGELFETYGHQPLAVDIYRVSRSLDRRVRELQMQLLDIRMVPVGQIFSRLAQVIRRYSRQLHKQVAVRLYGEDTNLDKFLAEEAVDPLMHIVRNALDHGIEDGAARRAAGKPEEATLTLRASPRGNHVVIEVRDDGRGIDLAKVREKALARGLLRPDVNYADREILEVIFEPGFSTAGTVTELSGRGVGMDAARDRIARLGGTVAVESVPGQGTAVAVTLPITLAILKALMVRVGRERFAVPLALIGETLRTGEQTRQTIEGRPVINLRGALLPVIPVGELFDLPHDEGEGGFAVTVGEGDRRIGLLVDELLGQHEIVIKSLGDYFEGLRGIAGATEIGKHELVLVLDIEALIDRVLLRQKDRAHV